MRRGPARDIAIVGMALPVPRRVRTCARSGRTSWPAGTARARSPPTAGPSRRSTIRTRDANDRVPCRRGGYLDSPIPFDPAAHGIMPRAVAGGEPEQFLVLDAAPAALADAGLIPDRLDGRRVEVVIGRGNYFNRGNLTRLQHGRIVAQTVGLLAALHPEWTREDRELVRQDLKASLPPFEAATIPGQLTNATAGRLADRLDLGGASFVVDAASASSLVALDLGCRALARAPRRPGPGGRRLPRGRRRFPAGLPPARRAVALGRVPGRSRPTPTACSRAKASASWSSSGCATPSATAIGSTRSSRASAWPATAGAAAWPRPAPGDMPGRSAGPIAIAGIDPATVGLVEGHGLGVPAADRAELRALRRVFPPPRARTRRPGRRLVADRPRDAGRGDGRADQDGPGAPPSRPAADRGTPTGPSPLLDRVRAGAARLAARPWIHGDPATPRRAGSTPSASPGSTPTPCSRSMPPRPTGSPPGAMPRLGDRGHPAGGRRSRGPGRPCAASCARPAREATPRRRSRTSPITLNTERQAQAGRAPAGPGGGLAGGARPRIWKRSSRGCATPPAGRSAMPGASTSGRSRCGGKGRSRSSSPAKARSIRGCSPTSARTSPRSAPCSTRPTASPASRARRCPRASISSAPRGPTPEASVGDRHRGQRRALVAVGDLPGAVAARPAARTPSSATAAASCWPSRPPARCGPSGRSSGSSPARCGLPRPRSERRDSRGPPGRRRAPIASGSRRSAAWPAVRSSVAIDNCPHQVVLAGPPDEVDRVVARLRAEGILCEDLPFARAYHTPSFAAVLGPLAAFFASLELHPPGCRSTRARRPAGCPSPPTRSAAWPSAQWTRPVAFRDTIEAMYRDGLRVFVDVGARGNLCGFVEDILRGRPAFAVAANLPAALGDGPAQSPGRLALRPGGRARPDLPLRPATAPPRRPRRDPAHREGPCRPSRSDSPR